LLFHRFSFDFVEVSGDNATGGQKKLRGNRVCMKLKRNPL